MKKEKGIKPIHSLFDKYKKTLKAPETSVKKVFVEVVEEVLGITLTVEAVQYKVGSKTLSLKVGGPAKTEIMMHKQELINHLKGRLGEKSAPREII